jgi:hypothetical protein
MAEIPSDNGGRADSGGRDRDRSEDLGPLDDPWAATPDIVIHRRNVWLEAVRSGGSRDAGYEVAAMTDGMDATTPNEWLTQATSYRFAGLILGWATDREGAVEMGARALHPLQMAWEDVGDRWKPEIRSEQQGILYGQLRHPDVRRLADKDPAIEEARRRIPQPGVDSPIFPLQMVQVATASADQPDFAATSFDRGRAALLAARSRDELDRHLDLVNQSLLYEAMARHLRSMETDGGYVVAAIQLRLALKYARAANQEGLQARIHLMLSDTFKKLETPMDDPNNPDSPARRHYDMGLELKGKVTGDAP